MNFYQILGVSENATEKEIKKSYKALVKKYHPDVFQGDKKLAEKKIKELNEAYEILSNPEFRNKYNLSLHSDPAIEISLDDSDTMSGTDDFKEYGDWYKKDLYQKAREKYTTHFYGISREDLKNEKQNSYSNYKESNRKINIFDKSRLILVVSISVIVLLILIIFLLSAIKTTINSNSKLLSSKYSKDNFNEDLPFIKLDLSFHDVKVLLGSPDYTETKGEYMYAYYDNSYIVFDSRNKVVDWKNNGAFNSETYTGSEYKILEYVSDSMDDF